MNIAVMLICNAGVVTEEDDISHLPPFANAENKALDKAVRVRIVSMQSLQEFLIRVASMPPCMLLEA